MGRKLIIQGADFSDVAVQKGITWIQKSTAKEDIVTNNVASFGIGAVSAWGCCARSASVNKPINVVRIHLRFANNEFRDLGTARIIKLVKGSSAVTGTYTTYATFSYNLNDVTKGYKTVYLDEPITLASTDEAIAVCKDNVTGSSMSSNILIDTGASHGNHYLTLNENRTPAQEPFSYEVCYDFGYLEQE